MKEGLYRVIERLQAWVRDGNPIAPGLWIDEAMRLLAFYGTESDRLVDMETVKSRVKWDYKQDNDCSDAQAESYVRTTQEYAQWRKQEQLVKQLDEYIRLAKKRATLASDEMKI